MRDNLLAREQPAHLEKAFPICSWTEQPDFVEDGGAWAPGRGGRAGAHRRGLVLPFSNRYHQRRLPPQLRPINKAIDGSRAILALPDDWDGEGSAAYSPATWQRATAFLWRNALRIWKRDGIEIAVPRIGPGPEGSIDLHWKLHEREVLLNVPAVADEPMTFYGDDHDNDVVKGTLPGDRYHEWLFLWLAQEK